MTPEKYVSLHRSLNLKTATDPKWDTLHAAWSKYRRKQKERVFELLGLRAWTPGFRP